MKKIYLTVLIVFISITFSLYLTEGYINYKLSINEVNVSKKIKLYEKEKNNKFDVRSKMQVYRDLIKKNSKITSVSAPSFMNDPNKKLFFLSGISNSKTISCNENGYYSIFESDRYGFNNPDNEWDKEEIEFYKRHLFTELDVLNRCFMPSKSDIGLISYFDKTNSTLAIFIRHYKSLLLIDTKSNKYEHVDFFEVKEVLKDKNTNIESSK